MPCDNRVTTQEQFQQYAEEGFTRIPVVREVLSDLDTPLSVYLKLADGPHTYLFESVEGGERFGRYSIIGLPARRVYAFAGSTFYATELGELVDFREVDDPFVEVERLRAEHRVPEIAGLPGFTCSQVIEPPGGSGFLFVVRVTVTGSKPVSNS